MKQATAVLFTLASLLSLSVVNAAEVSPLTKVFEEFTEWCGDRSKNVGFEIKTEKAQVETLKATIAGATATITSLEAKVGELTADIAKDEADLKAATGIRSEEAA